MSQTGILPSVVTDRSHRMTPDALSVLIAVPRIETARSKTRVDRGDPGYHATRHREASGRRPRRRLRRHVRLSACALVGVVPMIFAACFARSGQPVAISATTALSESTCGDAFDRVCLSQSESGRRDRFVDGRPTVGGDHGTVTLLSIESSNAATAPEAQAIVVLPGYLLPDNSRGEPVHEGS